MPRMSRLVALLAMILSWQAMAEEHLRLATTTSTDNSGLLAVLHPPFEAANDARIDVIAVGTGKALRLAQNGDVDVVLVHAPREEEQFVADGWGIERLPVMHNDFVILGPASDPAGVGGTNALAEAMRRISASPAGFISRGDDSGTHKMELTLWENAGITPGGQWYLAVGQGMGAVIKIADDKQAYTLADRGTYLAFRDKVELRVVFEGNPLLHNPYHVILVNPERHPHVNTRLANRYIDYIRGPEGQRIIGQFRANGELLFVPDVIR